MYGDPNHASQMSYYNDESYGAMDAKLQSAASLRNQRRRLNILGVATGFFVPWLLFTFVFAILSFSVHYTQPIVAYLCVSLGFIFVLVQGSLAVDSVRKQASGERQCEPKWHLFMFATCFLAWSLAVQLGQSNFVHNMQPFYDILNLNAYPSVDPSLMRGQQLMDAGRVGFSANTQLDLNRATGFKNVEMYCVAPVTIRVANTTNSMPLASYDFWAVGLNCCSGERGDFHCGDFDNPAAKGGLRLMNDDQRPFFRLAVQQAQAAFSIKSVHPLFFYWTLDPVVMSNTYQDDGFKYFLLGMFSHFALQLSLVTAAVLTFSKAGLF